MKGTVSMKKWTIKISCLILASALVVHLSGRTFALAEEPADTEDPPQIISDAPEEQDEVIDLNGQEDQEGQEGQEDQEGQENREDQEGQENREDQEGQENREDQEGQENREDQEGQENRENQEGQEDQEDQEDQKSQENREDQEGQEGQNDLQEENDLIEEVFVLSVDPELAAGQQMLMMDRSLSAEPAGAETDAGEEDRTAEITPLLVIGEQEIDLTADSSGESWKYNSADGSVELSGLNDAELLIGTAGQGLTIKAAGFNRIGSLIVDGDINLAGSGILLIDSVEFPLDSDFNLQTNTMIYTDGTCSVAVFIKQPDGTYLLVNDKMPGVLDGDCTIPAGVTLVMPANTTLVLQSVAKNGRGEDATYSTAATFETDLGEYEPYVTAPKLTIASGAALIVDQMAEILFHSISGTIETFESHSGIQTKRKTYAPSICVEGTLELDSDVTNAILSFGSEAKFSGTGLITNSTVEVEGGRQEELSTLHVKDSSITLKGDASLEGLAIDGNSSLNVNGNTTIGSISMKDGSTLTCYDNMAFGENHTVSITGSITAEDRIVTIPSGGTGPIDFSGLIDPTITLPGAAEIHLRSGVYVLEQGAAVSGVSFISHWQWGENTAYSLRSEKDAYGTAALFNYTGKTVTTNQEMIYETGPGSVDNTPTVLIPVTTAWVANIGEWNEPKSSAFLTREGSWSSSSTRSFNANQNLDLTSLSTAFGNQNDMEFVLEVVDANGRYSLVKVTAGTSIPCGNVKHIYAYFIQDPIPEMQGGGGSATDASVIFTGNGNLGGQAGSTTGGSSSRLFGGSGITNPITSHNTSGDDDDENGPGDDNGHGSGDDDNGHGSGDDDNGHGLGDDDNGHGLGDDDNSHGLGDDDNGHGSGDGDNGHGSGDDDNEHGSGDDDNGHGSGEEDNGNGSEEENNGGAVEKDNVTEQVVVLESETLILRIEPEADAKEESTVFVLTMQDEAGDPVLEFTEEIEIRMNYKVPSDQKGRNLYVVFRNEKGKLEAVRANIDPVSGKLVFRTDKPIGRFVIIALDFDGEEFSPEFYELLGRLQAVAALD